MARDLAYGQGPDLEIKGEGEAWGQMSYSPTLFPKYPGSGLGGFCVWLRQRSLVLAPSSVPPRLNLHPQVRKEPQQEQSLSL